MKKSLLLCMAAIALSATTVQAADNMAVQKQGNMDTYYGTHVENRLVIPVSGAGFSNPMNSTDNYTFGSWLKINEIRTSSLAGGVLLALAPINHNNQNGNWVLVTDANGLLTIAGHGGGNYGAVDAGISGTTGVTIDLEGYKYVAVSVDNDNLKFTIYVNGEEIYQASMNCELYYPSSIVNGDGNGYFCIANYGMSAEIDEAHLYNRVLSAEEIKDIYEGKLPSNGLKGYYTFDEQNDCKFANLAENAEEGSEAIFYKWSGQGNTWGPISGTVTPTEATLVKGRELDPSAIDNVAVDNANAPVEYFNLNGVKVAADNLGTGIYVRRQGNDIKKVLVK